MDAIEETLLSDLETKTTTEGYIDLMLASRVIGSDPLYEKALQGLIASEPKPTLEEAQLIGVDAYYAVMSRSRFKPRDHPCTSCHQTRYLMCNNCY